MQLNLFLLNEYLKIKIPEKLDKIAFNLPVLIKRKNA